MKRDSISRRRIPFCGGLLSGVLQVLVVTGDAHRALTWLALLPLFFSLARHSSRPGLRVIHALSFGVILCGASLHPFWDVFRNAYTEESAGWLRTVVACGLSWGSLCALWVLFGLASGPLFRMRPGALALVTIPLLWTGIEIGRSYIGSTWISSWLVLGYTLAPTSPEGQAAAVLGVYGLSFALVLTATAHARLLCDPAPGRQCLWAAAGCLGPILCFGYGLRPTPAEDVGPRVEVVAVAHNQGTIREFLRLTKKVSGTRRGCVVWPYVPAETRDDSYDLEFPREVEIYLQETSSIVVSALPPERPVVPLVLNASGQIEASAPPTSAPMASGMPLFPYAGGFFGVGLGSDFHEPNRARALAQHGAEFFLCSGGFRRGWSEALLRQEARFLAYRAVENRRWVAAATGASAFLFRPDGHGVFGLLSHSEGASGDELEATNRPSIYTKWGWWFEPVALASAVWLLFWSLLRPTGSAPSLSSERHLPDEQLAS